MNFRKHHDRYHTNPSQSHAGLWPRTEQMKWRGAANPTRSTNEPGHLREIASEMTTVCHSHGDHEAAHAAADRLLIECLRLAAVEWPTFERIADEWEEGSKHWWWA